VFAVLVWWKRVELRRAVRRVPTEPREFLRKDMNCCARGRLKPAWESSASAGAGAGEIVRKLAAAGISAAPRAGWVRTSPHLYIPPSDIDRMIDELP
jgi:hypothetical protein